MSRKKYNLLQDELVKEKVNNSYMLDSLQNENAILKNRITELDSTLATLTTTSPKGKDKVRPSVRINKKSVNLSTDEEYNSKALYIYNFCKYVQWPSGFQSNNFIIGIAGDSPLIQKLNSFTKGKRINNKKIVVRRYDQKDKHFFHILFVADSQSSSFNMIRNKLQNNPTLLVTENPSLASLGSHICFTIFNDKVKYMVNKSAAEKTGLKISQDLIKFAVE